MIWVFVAFLGFYVLIEHGCNRGPRLPGVPWRTRGEVNHEGLSRREQARR